AGARNPENLSGLRIDLLNYRSDFAGDVDLPGVFDRIGACISSVDVKIVFLVEENSGNAHERQSPAGVAGFEIESVEDTLVEDVKGVLMFDARTFAGGGSFFVSLAAATGDIVIERAFPKFFVRFIENGNFFIRGQHGDSFEWEKF